MEFSSPFLCVCLLSLYVDKQARERDEKFENYIDNKKFDILWNIFFINFEFHHEDYRERGVNGTAESQEIIYKRIKRF